MNTVVGCISVHLRQIGMWSVMKFKVIILYFLSKIFEIHIVLVYSKMLF